MILSGVLAPVPTPFDGADRLDTKRLKRALQHWLTSPLTGFVILGSTGEAPFLDDAEADRAVAAARDVVPRTRAFIVGTGRESTASAVRAAKRAGRLGADAVLVRTPGFFKNQLTSEALVGHYREIADASPVPVLLYQFPALTGVSLETHVVRQLAAHPNIVGLKDSSGDVLQISDFAASCSGSDFSVLTGSASTFYTAVCMGAAGGILALSCVLPDACARVFALAREGRHDEGRALQQRLLPVAKLVGSTYGVPGLKAALRIVGIDVGEPRRPLPSASDEAVDTLREELASFQELPV
jgi:4-hydroxy-2-oxoglutarate aldolase